MKKPLSLNEIKNKITYGVWSIGIFSEKFFKWLKFSLIIYPKVKYYQLFINPPKKISAVIRVKNEEEFLLQSVNSIIDHVEEIVIINNLSTDKTPAIIKKLKKNYPQKVFSFEYNYKVAKIGLPSKRVISKNKNSPLHLSNYTNWCLKKCRHPYILKWDGDMIATKEFYKSLKVFKNSKCELMNNFGLNIFTDRKHAVKTASDREKLDKVFYTGCFNSRLNEFTLKEFRIFPKKFSSFDRSFEYQEIFKTPFSSFPELILNCKKPDFLHLKFCKKNPFEIIPPNMEKIIKENLKPGRKIPKIYTKLLVS